MDSRPLPILLFAGDAPRNLMTTRLRDEKEQNESPLLDEMC
jgi:hypothetical protein